MSALISGGVSNVVGDGIIHITSTEATEATLNTSSILPTTVFNSSFSKNLLVDNIVTVSPIGSTFRQTAVSPTSDFYLREFPSTIASGIGMNNVHLSYAYSESVGKIVCLNGWSAIYWNDLNPYTWLGNTINTTAYSGLGLCSKFRGSPGFLYYLTCSAASYGEYSALMNAPDLKIIMYRINVAFNPSTDFFDTNYYFISGDINISTKSVTVNGVDLLDYKIVSVDYTQMNPLVMKASTYGASNIFGNSIVTGGYGNTIAINDFKFNTQPIDMLTIQKDNISIDIGNVHSKIFHQYQHTHVEYSTYGILKYNSNRTMSVTYTSGIGFLVLYLERTALEGTSTTINALVGIDPYSIRCVYLPYYSVGSSIQILDFFYRTPPGFSSYAATAKVYLDKTSETSFNVRLESWGNVADVNYVPWVYAQFISLY